MTLETDRPEYFLGENVVVNFVLENTGTEPFKASVGGDYRGCDRNLRFKVTATDEQGHVMPSPDPNPMCMGGLGTSLPVKPGEKLYFSLPIMRYCQFDKPGRYTIRASHDFGWKKDGDRKIPVGEITLTLKMPTPEEAAKVVDHMEKLSDIPSGSSWGKKSEEASDFRCLRYPVYLDILAPLAKNGDLRALEAIGKLPSPAATQTLIDLANGPDPKQSLNAAQTLNLRLPDPEFTGKLPARGPFNVYGTSVRKQLSDQSWNDSFSKPVRDLAKKFLAREDADSISTGAFMIEAVGTPEDAPLVFDAMTKPLTKTTLPRRNLKDDVLDYPAPLPELIRAVNILQTRGYDNSHPSWDAQFLGYFTSLSGKPGPRPADWLQKLNTYATANTYPLRQTALESIPDPLPDDCVGYVYSGLADKDYGVCRVACDIAGKSGRKEFLKPLIEIIQTENEQWLLRSAGGAANKLGGGYDYLMAWAGRLTNLDLNQIALDNLQSVLEGLPGGFGGRMDLTREELIAMQDAWKKFITSHEAELRQGKKFKYTDPVVTPALFGRARQWNLPDGTRWPPDPAK